MNYHTICEQNKVLYGELESLTTQINALKERHSEMGIKLLEIKKDELKTLIGINLDKIEQIWEVESLTMRNRPASRKRLAGKTLITPSRREERVILSYQFDSDQTPLGIAKKYVLRENTVHQIINKLINKEYIGYC